MNSLQCSVCKRLTWLILPVMAVFFMVNTVWATGPNVGLVVDFSPEVWLLRGTEKIPLALQSGVSAEDTLITGPGGRVQVLFEDDTVLTLGPSSQVLLAEYLYDGTAASHLEFDFAAGLSRVVTGKMVEANREGFKMRTPFSTMGIRGTMLSVLLPTLEGAKPENAIAQGTPEKVVLEQIGAGHNLSIQSAGTEVTMNRAGITAQVSPSSAPSLAPTTAEESRALQALAPTAAKAKVAEQPEEQPASQGTAKQGSGEGQAGQEGDQEQSATGQGESAPAGQATTTGTAPDATPGTGSTISTDKTPGVNISVSPPNQSGNNGQITTPIPKPENPGLRPGQGNNQPGTGNQPGNGVTDPIAPVPPKPPVDNGGGGLVPPPNPDPDPGTGGPLVLENINGSITSLNYSGGEKELKFAKTKNYQFHTSANANSPSATLKMELQDGLFGVLSPYLTVNGTTNRITAGVNGTTVEFGGPEAHLGYFLGKTIRSTVVNIHQVGSQQQHEWTIATSPEPFTFFGLLAPSANINGGVYTQDMTVQGLQIGVLTLAFDFSGDNDSARAVQADMRGLGVAESNFHLSQSISPTGGTFAFGSLVPTGSGPQKLFGANVTGGTATGVVGGQAFGGGTWTLTTEGALIYSGSGGVK